MTVAKGIHDGFVHDLQEDWKLLRHIIMIIRKSLVIKWRREIYVYMVKHKKMKYQQIPSPTPPSLFFVSKRERFISTSDPVSSKRQKHLKKDRYVVNFS